MMENLSKMTIFIIKSKYFPAILKKIIRKKYYRSSAAFRHLSACDMCMPGLGYQRAPILLTIHGNCGDQMRD
jgi:hypothetical protein